MNSTKITTAFVVCCLQFSLQSQTLNWSGSMGTTANDFASHIGHDASGNVYSGQTFGYTSGSSFNVDMDLTAGVYNINCSGDGDVAIAKYSPSGSLMWAHAIGGSASEILRSMTVDEAGNVYIGGDLGGSVDFDPGPGTQIVSPVNTSSPYIAKYDTDGNFLWAYVIHPDGFYVGNSVNSIAVNASGEIAAGIQFLGNCDMDAGSGVQNVTAANVETSVLRLNADGTYADHMHIAGDFVFGSSVAWNSLNQVILMGTYEGTMDVDPGVGVTNLTAFASKDYYLAKYSYGLDLEWANSFGGVEWNAMNEVAVDELDRIYVAGGMGESIDVDPSANTVMTAFAGSSDILMTRYDTDGNYINHLSVGSTGYDSAFGIELLGNGEFALYGTYDGTVDFNPSAAVTELTSANGTRDGFVIKYANSNAFLFGIEATDIASVKGITIPATHELAVISEYQDQVDVDPVGTASYTYEGGLYDVAVSYYSTCTPTPEVCDGLDNNCDGQIDEGFDMDGDGIADCFDNCPATANPAQADFNGDGIGDICSDLDGDGLADWLEIESGFDPLDSDTDGNGCSDADEFSYQCPDSVCDDCPADFNDDGAIDTLDLLNFLAIFGTSCPMD